MSYGIDFKLYFKDKKKTEALTKEFTEILVEHAKKWKFSDYEKAIELAKACCKYGYVEGTVIAFNLTTIWEYEETVLKKKRCKLFSYAHTEYALNEDSIVKKDDIKEGLEILKEILAKINAEEWNTIVKELFFDWNEKWAKEWEEDDKPYFDKVIIPILELALKYDDVILEKYYYA